MIIRVSNTEDTKKIEITENLWKVSEFLVLGPLVPFFYTCVDNISASFFLNITISLAYHPFITWRSFIIKGWKSWEKNTCFVHHQTQTSRNYLWSGFWFHNCCFNDREQEISHANVVWQNQLAVTIPAEAFKCPPLS